MGSGMGIVSELLSDKSAEAEALLAFLVTISQDDLDSMDFEYGDQVQTIMKVAFQHELSREIIQILGRDLVEQYHSHYDMLDSAIEHGRLDYFEMFERKICEEISGDTDTEGVDKLFGTAVRHDRGEIILWLHKHGFVPGPEVYYDLAADPDPLRAATLIIRLYKLIPPYHNSVNILARKNPHLRKMLAELSAELN